MEINIETTCLQCRHVWIRHLRELPITCPRCKGHPTWPPVAREPDPVAVALWAKKRRQGEVPDVDAEVIRHQFFGGGRDDFSVRGFGPTEHVYHFKLADGRRWRVGDNGTCRQERQEG